MTEKIEIFLALLTAKRYSGVPQKVPMETFWGEEKPSAKAIKIANLAILSHKARVSTKSFR